MERSPTGPVHSNGIAVVLFVNSQRLRDANFERCCFDQVCDVMDKAGMSVCITEVIGKQRIKMAAPSGARI